MGYLEHTVYHKLLRIALVVMACMLVFESGLMADATARLSDTTEQYLANAVGISVGVEPTELNQITAALTEKERQLAAREAAIAEREREIDVSISGGSSVVGADASTFILSAVLFILLVLVVLNYVLDFIRATRESRERTAASAN